MNDTQIRLKQNYASDEMLILFLFFGEPIAVSYEASKMSNESDRGHTSNILANKERVKSQNITQTRMAKICI